MRGHVWGVLCFGGPLGPSYPHSNTAYNAAFVQEIYLRYRCGEYPTKGHFYMLLYDDPYHASAWSQV